MTERLVIGHQTALDFWRASRVASEGQHVLDDAGRLYGGRDLRLKECAALAANLCNSSTPVDAVVDAVAERRRCPDICDHVFSGPLTKALQIKRIFLINLKREILPDRQQTSDFFPENI